MRSLVLGALTLLLMEGVSSAQTKETAAPASQPPSPIHYRWATAYRIPPGTTTEESGYFSLCEGKNGKIYSSVP
jgi:hypothetical protein